MSFNESFLQFRKLLDKSAFLHYFRLKRQIVAVYQPPQDIPTKKIKTESFREKEEFL